MDLFHLPLSGFAFWLPLAARLMRILPANTCLSILLHCTTSLAPGTQNLSQFGLAPQHTMMGEQDIYTQFLSLPFSENATDNTLHTNYVGKVSQMTATCLVQHTDTDTIYNKSNLSHPDWPSVKSPFLAIFSFGMSERNIQNLELHCWVVFFIIDCQIQLGLLSIFLAEEKHIYANTYLS